MKPTKLLVPIEDAITWEWLEEELAVAAEAAGVGEYDGGEEEGEYEVHLFFDMTPDLVRDLAASVLYPRGVRVVVTGKHEVTVKAA